MCGFYCPESEVGSVYLVYLSQEAKCNLQYVFTAVVKVYIECFVLFLDEFFFFPLWKTRWLPGIVVHNYNSDTWEDETGGLMLIRG